MPAAVAPTQSARMKEAKLAASREAVAIQAELRRRREEAKAQELAQMDELFKKYDEDSCGLLERHELEKLLTELMGKEPPSRVVDDVMKRAELRDDDGDGVADTTGIPRAGLVSALAVYKDYLEEQEFIDDIFRKFDKNANDVLEIGNDELRELMNEMKPFPDVMVEPGDVSWVLEEADFNKNGVIDRPELLAALAAWRHLSKHKLATKKSGCGCVIS